VCDTGPILHLREAQVLPLLEKTGEVVIPPAVEQELEARISNWARERPGWLQVAQMAEEVTRQAERWMVLAALDAGEAQAIALAHAGQGDWLLTDDARARVLAVTLGLEVHGSLGVVLWAAANGHLHRNDAFSALERLSKSSLWISPRVLNEARHALEQHLE